MMPGMSCPWIARDAGSLTTTVGSLDDSGIDMDVATTVEKSTDHWSQTLRCCICMEYFADPRVLSCGHTFCFGCVNTMLEHTMDSINQWQPQRPIDPNRVFIHCPQCRHRVYRYGVHSAPRVLALEATILGWKTSAERWDADITLANRNKVFSLCSTQTVAVVTSIAVTQTEKLTSPGVSVSIQTCELVPVVPETCDTGTQCSSLVTYLVSNYNNRCGDSLSNQAGGTNTLLKVINMQDINANSTETQKPTSGKDDIKETNRYSSTETQTEECGLTGGRDHLMQSQVAEAGVTSDSQSPIEAAVSLTAFPAHHIQPVVTDVDAACEDVTVNAAVSKGLSKNIISQTSKCHCPSPWIRWGGCHCRSSPSDVYVLMSEMLGMHSSCDISTRLTLFLCTLLVSVMFLLDSFFLGTSQESPVTELLTVCMLTAITLCSGVITTLLIPSLMALYIEYV